MTTIQDYLSRMTLQGCLRRCLARQELLDRSGIVCMVVLESCQNTEQLSLASARPIKRLRRMDPFEFDTLPPFATLTNDEDRERKALLRKLGTYHVVVNPASFAELDEYKSTGEDSNLSRRPSLQIQSKLSFSLSGITSLGCLMGDEI